MERGLDDGRLLSIRSTWQLPEPLRMKTLTHLPSRWYHHHLDSELHCKFQCHPPAASWDETYLATCPSPSDRLPSSFVAQRTDSGATGLHHDLRLEAQALYLVSLVHPGKRGNIPFMMLRLTRALSPCCAASYVPARHFFTSCRPILVDLLVDLKAPLDHRRETRVSSFVDYL